MLTNWLVSHYHGKADAFQVTLVAERPDDAFHTVRFGIDFISYLPLPKKILLIVIGQEVHWVLVLDGLYTHIIVNFSLGSV